MPSTDAWIKRQFNKSLDDPRFRSAQQLPLVCDNINTRDFGSLYIAFLPEETQQVMDRLKLVSTPKHGSWLDLAEVELSVLIRQVLNERLVDISGVEQRVTSWCRERNQKQVGVDWHFSTDNVRNRLKSFYPKIQA